MQIRQSRLPAQQFQILVKIVTLLARTPSTETEDTFLSMFGHNMSTTQVTGYLTCTKGSTETEACAPPQG